MKMRILPLKQQILLLIGTLGICILFVSLYSMHSYSRLQTATIKNNQELYSKQVLQSAEKNFEDLKNIASSIAYNQVVQQYLMESDKEKKFTLYQQIMNLLNNTKALNNSIMDFSLLDKEKNAVNLSGDTSIYQDFYDKIPDENQPIYYMDKTAFYIGDKSYSCQIAAMPVYQLSSTTTNFIGILFITFNLSNIFGDNLYADNSIPNELLFLNSKNQLLLGNEDYYKAIKRLNPDSGSFDLELDNQIFNCQKFTVKAAGGTLYTLVNQSRYTLKIREMVLHQSLLILITFLIAVLILLTFFKPITASLGQLTEIMNKISSGKRKALNERITIDTEKRSCMEVYSIANSFNEMLDEINLLNHDIFNTYSKMFELEMMNRKTEIAFLRSQINPHFLYNTLTLISGMASMNETEGVIEIAQALSQIYRYSIKGEDIVTVNQELEITKSYVKIQTTRFEDRFAVSYDFKDEVMDALIPRMIIQPLVENAIKHGLENSLKKGALTIGGRKNPADDTLVLWVYDTGSGMTEERLLSLRKLLESSLSHNGKYNTEEEEALEIMAEHGVGLCNVNNRIKLYYGEPYRLHIDSEENIGTNIQIKIPFQKNSTLF